MLSHAGPAGRRRYLLHEPAAPHDADATTGRPLIVMLHGGMQTAAEFAATTAMNTWADQCGFLVAYPQQGRNANPNRFWNWFRPEHQCAGSGEPAILAALTEEIVHQRDVDPTRVFIAGFSSGGAMAAVVAATSPDLFAAAGVHSGLGYRSARDEMSAWSAMNSGAVTAQGIPLPLIVFHGERDTTVAAINADQLIAATTRTGLASVIDEIPAGGGARSVRRTVYTTSDGTRRAEYWLVRGGGHAWSGGIPGGRFADPRGPSASQEMVRFFLGRP